MPGPSQNTLEAIIAARDEFTAVFERIMGRAMTTMAKGQRQSDFFSGSLTRMFAKFSIIEHGLRRLGSIIEQTLYPFKAVEEINMSLIRMSAMFTGMMEVPTGGKTIADQFQQSFAYSERLFQTLVKINPYIAGGLKDLLLITEEMAKQGIALDINNAKQVQAFQNIANAVIVVSAGYQNREAQIRQEARSLMEGVIRPTNQLAMIVNAMVGGNLKVMTDQWKRQGIYLEKMGELLKGFEAAGGRISLTWDAVYTTFQSIIQLAMYEKFQKLYLDLMRQGTEFNDWLMKNRETVAGYIKATWDALANSVIMVGQAFKDLGKILSTVFGEEFIKTVPKNLLFFFTTILPKLYETATVLGRIGKILDDMEKRGKPTKEEEGVLDIAKEAFGPVAKALKRFGIRLLQEAGWDINETISEYKNLGIQLGEARAEGEESRYVQRWKEFQESRATALALKPQPPDPEALKKLDEFLDSMQSKVNKASDVIWGPLFTAYDKGWDLLMAAGGDEKNKAKFIAVMEALSKEAYKKQEIADIEQSIKLLKIDKDSFVAKLEIVDKTAEIMRIQKIKEIDIEQFVAEKKKEIWEGLEAGHVKDIHKYLDELEVLRKEDWKTSAIIAEEVKDRYKAEEDYYHERTRITSEITSQSANMYDYLLERTGKYYNNAIVWSRELLDKEKDRIIETTNAEINGDLVHEYITQKKKARELEIKELRLKHSDIFLEGWNVAYQKNLQDQYTWGQAGLQAYGEVSKAMSQTFSDFFYDAWTGKLKTAEQYFRSFTQSLLRAWADMVSKMLAQEAMLKLTRYFGGYGGPGPQTSGQVGYQGTGYEAAGLYHGGGYVPRLHRGLASDEFPAILQSGERVLSRNETTSLDSTRGRGGDTNIYIQATDANSFINLLAQNRGALASLVANDFASNGQTRKMIRGR